MSFDPNAAAPHDSGIFGLPFSEAESQVVYLPVPWEATTSYGGGTSLAPSAILKASHQVDLYDLEVLNPYEAGLHLLPESKQIKEWNVIAKNAAQKVLSGEDPSGEQLKTVNELSKKLDHLIETETLRLLKAGKIVGILGGDHSVPFGAIKAIAKQFGNFGILHFDAHSDTRDAYEGFTGSHASIMRNVLEQVPEVTQLVQVGIRDLCEQEIQYNASQKTRVQTFFDHDLKRRQFDGVSWTSLCRQIIEPLPNSVWISFDIDGLDPRFCPNTGTPVPGGLELAQATHLISTLVASGRKIIGFDLNEVAPDTRDLTNEWDSNVGARLLYKLTAWTLLSQNKRSRV